MRKYMDKLLGMRLAYLVLLLFPVRAQSQVNKSSELFRQLQYQDSVFFERGFNQCDLEYLKDKIADDLKFYHDQSGYQDRNTFLDNIQKNICTYSGRKPIRKADTVSLEVFPLYNDGKLYGAIQKGVHHFYLREMDKTDVWTSTAKFTHVWILEGETWILSEVLSYDHKDPGENKTAGGMGQMLIDSQVPAMGIGIIENGILTRVEVYGTLDQHRTAPYNTIFNVASLTKPVVVIVTLKLIDHGLLALDEPLFKYWIDPDLKYDERYKKLTPRNILSHQSGFPNWRYLSESNKLNFEFDPGTKFQYSGEGFEYLRKAIENKLGKSIEELAREYVFNPAGMNETYFWWEPELDTARYAHNFNQNGEEINVRKYYEANAASNLLTTIEDYGKFLAYVINGAGLSESLYQEMIEHQVQLKDNDFFGLGWEIMTGFPNQEYAMLHSGKDPGVSTVAVWYPVSKNGFVVFLNGDNVDDIYARLLTEKLYLGKELWNKR